MRLNSDYVYALRKYLLMLFLEQFHMTPFTNKKKLTGDPLPLQVSMIMVFFDDGDFVASYYRLLLLSSL